MADALVKRAAERGVSLDVHLSDLARSAVELTEIEMSAEERAELALRVAEWERDRLGVLLDEVAAWMRSWGRPDELLPPRARRL